MTETEYKIATKSINGRFLTYKVKSYKIIGNSLIEFKDRFTNRIKRLPLMNCEIEVLGENENENTKNDKYA